MKRHTTSRPRVAFTLVELLVVIAIIGVLVALLLPAVQAAREAARRNACMNLLKQHSTGLQSYHAQNLRFPPGGRTHANAGDIGVSWRVLLLPFLEEQALHDRIDPQPSGGASDWDAQQSMPKLFWCPSAPADSLDPRDPNKSHYWGVGGAARAGEGLDLEDFACGDLDANGVLYPDSETTIAKIADGTSQTLALGERSYRFRMWMTGATSLTNSSGQVFRLCSQAANQLRYPINASHEEFGYYVDHSPLPEGGEWKMLQNDLPFGSHHPGGAQFAMADSSVHFLSDDIDFTVFEDLATVAGGEVIDSLR